MNPNAFDQDEGFDPEDDDVARRPSKSALKRASHELQALGEQLLAMPDSRLADIDMPERLRDALADYKTTRSFEGKRRQLQYIGKVIRSVDAEPLREAVAAFQLGHARNALSLHEAERWRTVLLENEKSALTDWVAEFPDTDLQQLRALIRNARKDAAAVPEQRNGRAYRELFQFIKKAQEAAAPAKDAAGAPVPDVDEDA
ncbi:MAG TPA: ribosome biogenesis factor YjgA [Aquabacterium sp.]|uniref:ribosome biogenesis factor YjgA n=1 Tax=Aquabacterium sp. TaxID=1872578 RepID=UPI002DA89399|nr:ribosome biogenesis factor YjgA [Aquabacterium sp.]HET6789828.1 ribosome biogenesis factor YjgA [Aquabacterium sp.]HEX5373420.1 ribosome biogenesis factor YjgA [Aquabacterium sp.]